MIWQGTYGNDIYNNTRYYGEGMFGYTNCLPVRKIDTGQKNYHYKSSIRRYYNIPKNTDTNIPRAVLEIRIRILENLIDLWKMENIYV